MDQLYSKRMHRDIAACRNLPSVNPCVRALFVCFIMNKRIYLWCMHASLLHLGPTLCDPMDCSPPGSSVHGILQERIWEWVAMPYSRGSSRPKGRAQNPHLLCLLHWQVCSLTLAH